ADLLSSTARQRGLGRLLGLPPLRYLHVPLILDAGSGLKLSKQNGAPPIDTGAPLAALQEAWRGLGFAPIAATDREGFLSAATAHWARRFPLSSTTN
ncbi:MAG TPA: tRNA glutamyl-Q(34) synthetase GluQRS, partial [Achromobacter sp.]|nr:tRNA glutamyl-Q(34) synthetase GluQRS [Achromobacter sp.]